jgi:Mor family transcriptional regulator
MKRYMDEHLPRETGTKRMAATDEETDIIASYQQGLSVPVLADRYEVSDKHIYYLLKKRGITLRRRSGVGKVLNQAQEAEMVASYQQGIDAVQLARRYGVGSTTVYTVLARYGVQRRTNSEIFRKLSPAQEAEILASYQHGLAASQIASRYGIHDQTVYNILERHRVTRRTLSEAAITYPRNEHAFDVIDNEEAAYWLGFIAADGNVSNGRLRIGLSTKDADHVRKFAGWLAPSMPIYTGTNNHGRPVSTVDIGSKYLVETLGTHGIVPRKTYVMKRLPSVPHALMRHLIRGFIDADGYLSLRVEAGARFGVVALNREIVAEIQDWFIQELGVRRTALIHSARVWHYRQYGTLQVSKIAAYLYRDASVYLDRKYQLAQRMM